MTTLENKIITRFETVTDKDPNALKKLATNIENIANKMDSQVTTAQQLRKTNLGMTADFGKNNKIVKALTNTFGKMNFSLFGALFLGQAVSSAFLGLFKNSSLLAPIFDAIGTIIDAALLPVFLPLALGLLWLSQLFLKLPEPLRIVIGVVILVIGILATLISWIAFVGLSWAGVVVVLGIVGMTFAEVAAAIFWPITAIIALIAFVIRLISVWDDLKKSFSSGQGIFEKIANIAKVFTGFGTPTAGGVPLPAGATGGIVSRPTIALIGESGPEAVVPLSNTPGSSALPSGGGSNVNIPITINVLDAASIMHTVNSKLSEALRRAGVR